MTNLKENTMIKKLTVVLVIIAIAIAAFIAFSPNQAHADIDSMPLIVVDTSTTSCETPSLGMTVYDIDVHHDSTSLDIHAD